MKPAPATVLARLSLDALAADVLRVLAAVLAAAPAPATAAAAGAGAGTGASAEPVRVVFVGHSVGGAVAAHAAAALAAAAAGGSGGDSGGRGGLPRAALGGLVCLDATVKLTEPAKCAAAAAALARLPGVWVSLAAAEASAATERGLATPAQARLSARDTVEAVTVAAATAAANTPDASPQWPEPGGTVYRRRVPVLALRPLWPRWYASLVDDVLAARAPAGRALTASAGAAMAGSGGAPVLLVFSSLEVAPRELIKAATAPAAATPAAASAAGGAIDVSVVPAGHWFHEREPVAVAVRVLRFLESHGLLTVAR
jgi:pimeloyl-ACP methyl ester carboxylesterase